MGVQIWGSRWQFDGLYPRVGEHAQELFRIQWISIMHQIAFTFEESVHLIGEIAGNLAHPQSIRLACDSSDLHPSSGQIQEEEHDKPLQPVQVHTSTVKKSVATI